MKGKFAQPLKVSKQYEDDCLRNFHLLFKSSLTALIFSKQSYFAWHLLYLSIKKFLHQTWKAFNKKSGLQRKDRESSYQVRQILALTLEISCSNFRLKLC